MVTQIFTSFNENELRQLIKSCLEEVLGGMKSPTSTPNALLTVEQAALFLNLAPQTLYGYTSKRLIPFVKKGKKLYFQKDKLEAWLMEGKKLTQAEIAESVGLSKKGGNRNGR